MWKDTTTYSQGDKERKPTTFTVVSGVVKIVITFGHIRCPGAWVMHAYTLGIDTKRLEAKTLEEAKAESVKVVKDRLMTSIADLDTILAAI